MKWVLLILLILASFQNCAKVQFSSNARIEAESLESGNGEIYTGSFVVYDHENLCEASDIVSEIALRYDYNYFLIRENCTTLEMPLKITQDVVATENGLVFLDRFYMDQEVEDPTQIPDDVPKSCQEIFDRGESNGNGFYQINPQGQVVEEVYCNMEILEFL